MQGVQRPGWGPEPWFSLSTSEQPGAKELPSPSHVVWDVSNVAAFALVPRAFDVMLHAKGQSFWHQEFPTQLPGPPLKSLMLRIQKFLSCGKLTVFVALLL